MDFSLPDFDVEGMADGLARSAVLAERLRCQRVYGAVIERLIRQNEAAASEIFALKSRAVNRSIDQKVFEQIRKDLWTQFQKQTNRRSRSRSRNRLRRRT